MTCELHHVHSEAEPCSAVIDRWDASSTGDEGLRLHAENAERLANVIHDAMPDEHNWRPYFRRVDEPDGWSLEIRRTLSKRIAAAVLAAGADRWAEAAERDRHPDGPRNEGPE